ncbi:MAG: hypothetical protein ABL958_10315, partial [Bdellovibrionia bacterium]
MIRAFIALSLLFTGTAAFAHPTGSGSAVDCRRLWDLEKELGCFAYHPSPIETTPEKKEFTMESQFGPSQCKALNAIDAAKKELKTECDGWLKERKADLGTKYRTGTCNAKCDPCGSG